MCDRLDGRTRSAPQRPSSVTIAVALIGFGAIGQGIHRLARTTMNGQVKVVGALVRRGAQARSAEVPVVHSVDALLDLGPDVVVECAGHEALRAFGPLVLTSGRDLVVLSVGALADPDTLESLRAATQVGKSRLRIASGAIGGLDAIASASIGGLDSVRHTIRKPARVLLGDGAIGLTAAREIYNGPARAGVMQFPESANVVAAVSLAGIGLDRTQMCVVADPAGTCNWHVVEAEGDFGALRFEIRSIPTDENPRTGRLAAMSAIRAVLSIDSAMTIG